MLKPTSISEPRVPRNHHHWWQCSCWRGLGAAENWRGCKGHRKALDGPKPTHPTQTEDLSKRIPIRNYTFNSSKQKKPIWRTVKAPLPEQYHTYQLKLAAPAPQSKLHLGKAEQDASAKRWAPASASTQATEKFSCSNSSSYCTQQPRKGAFSSLVTQT